MSGYCSVAPGHEWHGPYHESHYGFPIAEDDQLFERLILEINQAGLSWLTILKRQEEFRRAYRDFSIDKVARFGARDVERLLNDAGIIRNRLKVAAAVENAKRIRVLQKQHGSFAAWLAAHHPLTKAEWVKLFKKTFVFTGGEIVGEFLMSIGYLPGAHHDACPIYKKIAKQKPAWMQAEKKGFDFGATKKA
jgi:DNA-3-methyladenine glycosylase I